MLKIYYMLYLFAADRQKTAIYPEKYNEPYHFNENIKSLFIFTLNYVKECVLEAFFTKLIVN